MRLDKLLWFLRLTKTRSQAQALVSEGHIRINQRRIERASHRVQIGDILVIPLAQSVRILELVTMPTRRGPALEAQSCYRVLDERGPMPIAAGTNTAPLGSPIP